MVPSTEGGGSDPLTDYSVIDCDVHVLRPERVQNQKAEYMEMPYRVQVDPDQAGLGGGYPSPGQIVDTPEDDIEYTRTESGGISEIDEELREPLLEEHGVDIPILNMGPLGLNALIETDRRRQEMRATNNTLLDLFLDGNDDFVGLASIAPTLPDITAREIDRIADEERIVGLYTDVSYVDPPLGDSKYDPVFEAAEEAGLPIVLHGSHSSVYAPNLVHSVESHLEEYTTGHVMGHTINLASLLYKGVPERYPDLEFVCLSGGVGLWAGLVGRLNHDYERRRFDAPLLDAPPEEYIRDQFYFGTQPLDVRENPEHLRSLVDIVGPESLVFASNHPLYDFDAPGKVADCCDHLEPAELEAIFHGNATDVFGLEDVVDY